jgi:diguanylate cyclase (GGDEF)-like protein/PAS domain S-box-containing protein
MDISATDRNENNHWLPPLQRLGGVVFVLCCLEISSCLMNIHSWSLGGVTILWPANGLLLGVLLCAPRRQWPAYLAAGFAVDFGINSSLSFHFSLSFWTAAYLSLCNMLEVGLAAALLYRTISPKPDLTQRKQLVNLLLYGVVLAPAVAAVCAQLNTTHAPPLPLYTAIKYWFTADALGIAVMTPLYLSFNRRERFSGRSLLEITGLLTMLLAATLAVFWQTRFPALFLLLPFLLLLGVRLRLGGSAIGLFIISIVGGYFTIAGRGPFALMHTSSAISRELALQFFIAVTILTLYIIDVVIAERERLQESLQVSEIRFRMLADASNDVIVLSNLLGERNYVSPAITAALGWLPEELLGQDYRQIVHPDDVASLATLLENCLAGKPVETLCYRCRKKDDSYLWMEASIRLYRDQATGKPVGFVNVVRDISNRKAAEQELNLAFSIVANLAMLDGLTGIANRRQFDETMERELRRAMRDGSMLSVLMIDVDHFKTYNDLYGHVLGDACLRQVAVAAQDVLHRTSDLFARYGGEEFVAILPNTDSRGAQVVAELIRSAVERCRLPHAGNTHGIVTVSIGCATQMLSPDTVGNPILQAADEALYEAKAAGRNRIEVAQMLPATT